MNKLIKLLICFLPFYLWSIDSVKHPKQQILRINFLEGAPRFLHPHLACNSDSLTLCKSLFEGLTRFNLNGDLELAIAKKIEISACRTKYTIHLRTSFWSNKEKLTAYHFVDAWKAAVSPQSKCTRSSRFFIIKNAEKIFKGELPIEELGIYAPNKFKIIVHLKHPIPYFTQLLADPVFAPLFDITSSIIDICNGPFIISNFQPSNKIQLKKNKLYWDAKIVKLDGIEISLVRDEMTAYKLFQEGKLDYIGSPFSDLPEDIMHKTKNLKKIKTYSPYWIHFNLNNPKLQSIKIRKALSLAVNKEQIANFILPNAAPNYKILPDELSSLETPFKSTSEKVIQELFLTGLKELNCKRKDYIIEITSGNSFRHLKVAEYLKNCWENTFNIKVNIKKNDWSVFLSNLYSNNFAIIGLAQCTTFKDPSCFLEYFLFPDRNYSNWQNSEFNHWMSLANDCKSESQRLRYLSNAENILMDEVPVIALYTHQHLYLCHPALKGFIPLKLVYSDFKYCYFEEN
jgi:oligopeptide transport system substrate-binding protein